MKKKILIFLGALLTIIVLAVGIYFIFIKDDDSWGKTLDDKTKAYENVLSDSIGSFKSPARAKNYLLSWANSNNVKVDRNSKGIIVMHRGAAKEYAKVGATTLICHYDTKAPSSNIVPLSIAFSILKSDRKFGPLNVVFVADSDRSFSSIKHIPKKYLTDDTTVIALNQGNKHMLSLMSGGSKAYNMNKAYTTEPARKDNGFKITIKGVDGGIPDTKISSYPSPVVELGTFLAKAQSESVVFQLASFNGGNSSSLYPTSASAVILIDNDDVDKFQLKIDNLREKLADEFASDYPKFKVVYESAPVPESVISKSDSSKLLSMLYTMIDGVYYKDEDGDIVAISSINSVKTADNNMAISMNINSLSSAKLNEMHDAVKVLSGLSEFNVKKLHEINIWADSKNTKFAQSIMTAYNIFTRHTLEYKNSVPTTACTYLAEMNSKMPLLSITSNEEYSTDDAGTIITYMMALNQ